MTTNEQIRVGIRGIGLLGSRLLWAIGRTQDMRCTVGVVVPDKSLDGLLARAAIQPRLRACFPEQMFVSVPKHMGRESQRVRELNARQRIVEFEGASQLDWKQECDVIVDTAWPAGRDAVEKQYQTFPGPILLQDGAGPKGRLIVPPVLASERAEDGKFWRLGDCMVSGIVPLLYPFHKQVARARLSVLMQYDGREPDYLIPERAHAWYLRDDLREKLRRDLGVLYPRVEVEVASVVQIPSMLHYEVTVELELYTVTAQEQARAYLATMPHVRILPPQVTSTYELNLVRGESHDGIPPITVLAASLEPAQGQPSRRVRFCAALYYRQAAILPNVDAIRIAAQGADPVAAMRQTDRDMGFV